VLYRALLATQRIAPDPAQHRLALRLQSLHERLLDYEPVGARWEEFKRNLPYASPSTNSPTDVRKKDVTAAEYRSAAGYRGTSAVMRNFWQGMFLRGNSEARRRAGARELVRQLSSAEEAMRVDAPKGLLVHGPVGSGKSMLMDMLMLEGAGQWAVKGARWHYEEFMLHVVRNLSYVPLPTQSTTPSNQSDKASTETEQAPKRPLRESDSIVSLACSLIQRSPLLMIDEFQLPDRMAAKTLANLLTVFFRLGGVLVATSNRLPDELAKASGREYAAAGEFADFVDLLKAKCEVWEMESFRDYRRLVIEEGEVKTVVEEETDNPKNYVVFDPSSPPSLKEVDSKIKELFKPPKDSGEADLIPWKPQNILVYGRQVSIPLSYKGTSLWSFSQLCTSRFGPADYISLASTCHTFIITDIPILTSQLKNEARRLITAIDAFYEAGCKLFITAAASPDNLFFPDETQLRGQSSLEDDAMHAETFAEVHQDLTEQFLPNISSYAHRRERKDDALEDEPPGRIRKAALSHLSEMERLKLYDELLDFKKTESFVGEDELFAYKRAVSRIWEMCSAHWWARESIWKPMAKESRHWESDSKLQQEESVASFLDESMFQSKVDIAPKFHAENHAWGMVERDENPVKRRGKT
jgi:peroxisome-assembly ATPase